MSIPNIEGMNLYVSLCKFEGERIKQRTYADTEKEAINMLKRAGFKVLSIEKARWES